MMKLSPIVGMVFMLAELCLLAGDRLGFWLFVYLFVVVLLFC